MRKATQLVYSRCSAKTRADPFFLHSWRCHYTWRHIGSPGSPCLILWVYLLECTNMYDHFMTLKGHSVIQPSYFLWHQQVDVHIRSWNPDLEINYSNFVLENCGQAISWLKGTFSDSSIIMASTHWTHKCAHKKLKSQMLDDYSNLCKKIMHNCV